MGKPWENAGFSWENAGFSWENARFSWDFFYKIFILWDFMGFYGVLWDFHGGFMGCLIFHMVNLADFTMGKMNFSWDFPPT